MQASAHRAESNARQSVSRELNEKGCRGAAVGAARCGWEWMATMCQDQLEHHELEIKDLVTFVQRQCDPQPRGGCGAERSLT